ncbi:hypothetical protein [Streptomyces sp. NPDC056549]
MPSYGPRSPTCANAPPPHVHHRVIERFPDGAHGAEMFRTARQIVHASRQ